MAPKIKILTAEQERFLDLISQDPYFCKRFYLTGGTPLAAFYLFHRLSEDIDLFSKEDINLLAVKALVGKIQKKLKLKAADYRQFLGLHTFQLFFPNKKILKIDFNYYPFEQIEPGIKYKNIKADSILDIAVNKVQTIAMQPRSRDFIDIYFIIKEMGYSFSDLLKKARIKFDWHVDPVQLGSRLFLAKNLTDYPRMVKQINHREWQKFFTAEAKKLKNKVLS